MRDIIIVSRIVIVIRISRDWQMIVFVILSVSLLRNSGVVVSVELCDRQGVEVLL